MKKKLMEILACPIDKHCPLELLVFEEKEEIVEGLIICPKCLRWYPIRDEIPEMLPDELRKEGEDSIDRQLGTHRRLEEVRLPSAESFRAPDAYGFARCCPFCARARAASAQPLALFETTGRRRSSHADTAGNPRRDSSEPAPRSAGSPSRGG